MAHINTKSASKAACILHELVFPSAPHMPQFLKESALLLFDCLRLICDGSFHDNAAPEMLWCTPGNRQTSSKEEGFVSVTEKQVRSGHCATTRTATTVSSCSISSLSILPFSWKSLKVGVDYFEVHDSNRWAYFQGAFVSKWFRPFPPPFFGWLQKPYSMQVTCISHSFIINTWMIYMKTHLYFFYGLTPLCYFFLSTLIFPLTGIQMSKYVFCLLRF